MGHRASSLGVPDLVIAGHAKRIKQWRPGWTEGKVITPPSWLPNWKERATRPSKRIKYRMADQITKLLNAYHANLLVLKRF